MITWSGVYVDHETGCPTAEDVAVGAGRVCRFAGGVWQSLLSHLVLVGMLGLRYGSMADCLWGLLHDAHEVVTSDVPKPFKCACIKKVQRRVDAELTTRFMGDLGEQVDHALLKELDFRACDLEAVTLRLPGYRERAVSLSPEYRGRQIADVWSDPGDLAMAEKVLRGHFNSSETVLGLDYSWGVAEFRHALKLMESGRHDLAVGEVTRWMH